MRILIVGLTTRAIAESARRAGCEIVTIDLFGDADQKRLCENVSLRERRLPYSARAFLSVARELHCDAVAYTGGLENEPGLVAALAAGKILLGNGPGTLRRVRDPGILFPFLVSRGFLAPRTIAAGAPAPRGGAWLLKPVRSGGGRGVRAWDGRPIPAGAILQEYVEGVSASCVLVADGRRCALLGASEQLRGPEGFLYGGNLFPLAAPAAAVEEVRAIGEALTAEFGLLGLNGFDFILREDRPVLVEVNPRYCASMELVERATGAALFGLHLDVFRGALPGSRAPGSGVWGKAIVYAVATVAVGDTRPWIERGVRDVPPPGALVRKGQPICTVLAHDATRAGCLRLLKARAERVLAETRTAAIRAPAGGP